MWLNVCMCVRSDERGGPQAVVDHPAGFGVGGAVAACPDRVVVGAAHGRAGDREDRVHVRGPGPGGDPQLQRRRLRLVGAEVCGWPTTDVHASRSGGRSRRSRSSRPTDHDLPFSTWSLSKLAEFLVAEGVVDDISHEGLRVLLREEGVSFQAIKTFKVSNDPDFEAKKNRVLELYDIADGKVMTGPGDPTVVICVDEFGPLNLQPHPGKQWAPVAAGKGDTASPRRRRRRATYSGRTGFGTCSPVTTCRPTGSTGTSRPARAAPSSSRSCVTCGRCIQQRCGSRSCWTTSVRTCPRRKTLVSATGQRANNVELAYVPFYASWLNRIEAQFTALRYFALDGTDHPEPRHPGPHDPPLHRLAEPPRPRPSPTRTRESAQTLPLDVQTSPRRPPHTRPAPWWGCLPSHGEPGAATIFTRPAQRGRGVSPGGNMATTFASDALVPRNAPRSARSHRRSPSRRSHRSGRVPSTPRRSGYTPSNARPHSRSPQSRSRSSDGASWR